MSVLLATKRGLRNSAETVTILSGGHYWEIVNPCLHVDNTRWSTQSKWRSNSKCVTVQWTQQPLMNKKIQNEIVTDENLVSFLLLFVCIADHTTLGYLPHCSRSLNKMHCGWATNNHHRVEGLVDHSVETYYLRIYYALCYGCIKQKSSLTMLKRQVLGVEDQTSKVKTLFCSTFSSQG